MIRFMPDTWADALWRPFAMGAPDSWVYTEISAPDLRFALLIGVLLGTSLLWRAFGRRASRGRDLWLLSLPVLLISFFAWLATSGNGRYFMPYLVLIGPVLVGGIYWLPCTAHMRAALLIVALVIQGHALGVSNPWGLKSGWGLVSWDSAGYFDLEVSPLFEERGVMYVSYISPSFSIIATKFHWDNSWVNSSVFHDEKVVDDDRFRSKFERLVKSRSKVRLVFPAKSVDQSTAPQLTSSLTREIGNLVRTDGFVLKSSSACRFLRSRSMQALGASMAGAGMGPVQGFWFCDANYVGVERLPLSEAERFAHAVFSKMEKLCPRNFPAGSDQVRKSASGYVRDYPSGDVSLILTFDGKLYLKYLRAMNHQLVGQASDIIDERSVFRCNGIVGRQGLPWERGV